MTLDLEALRTRNAEREKIAKSSVGTFSIWQASKDVSALIQEVESLRAMIIDNGFYTANVTAELAALRECDGHNAPCYYCGKPCSSLSAHPNLWPLPLCHEDDPGVMKWHHTSCVHERLNELAALREQVTVLIGAIDQIAQPGGIDNVIAIASKLAAQSK